MIYQQFLDKRKDDWNKQEIHNGKIKVTTPTTSRNKWWSEHNNGEIG